MREVRNQIQHRFNCFKFNCLKNINSIDTTMVISEQVNSVAFALIRLNIHHSLCVWKYDSLCVCTPVICTCSEKGPLFPLT